MSQTRALSSDEVQHLRDELAAGRTPTVWFTPSAVGVPEGRSGKVTALGEVEEGDFVQVRPASSRDVLSFSATEITLDRPPRKRKDDTTSGTATSAKTSGAANTSSTTTTSAKPAQEKAASEKAGARNSAASQQNRSAGAEQTGRSAGSAEKSGAAQKSGNAEQTGPSPKSRQAGSNAESKRKPRSISGATITLTADENGQWNVEVNTGKKRTLRPKIVSASAVAHAAKALHEDVAAAVEPLLESAREQQRARVEELQRELADAQRTLDDLAE